MTNPARKATMGADGSLLVSICINNFNYAAYVGEAIESALAQDYRPLEVIVVDDGSTDGSRQVIEGFAGRIQVILTENHGQGAALNTGFQASSGDVVMFLDADDRLRPDAASKVADVFRRQPQLAKVQFRLDVIDRFGRLTGISRPKPGVSMPRGDLRDHASRFRTLHWQPTSGNAYAAHYLRRVLPADETLYWQGVDGYLNELAVLLGPIESLDETLGEYRFHGRNDSAGGGHLSAAYFQRRIALIEHNHAAARRLTADAGAAIELAPSPTDVLDVAFLTYRLASLRLDPAQHPLPGDRRRSLAWRGVHAALRTPMLSLKQRVVRTTWFVAVAALPGPLARAAIDWWTPDTFRQSHRKFRFVGRAPTAP